jgi:hypothetical protein
MANGITFVTPMPLTILIVFQFCCLKYRSRLHSILIVAKSTQFGTLHKYNCIHYLQTLTSFNRNIFNTTPPCRRAATNAATASRWLRRPAWFDPTPIKKVPYANPALLEKENNSGYYTAQEGLSFTVVEQSATHPRSRLKLTVVKTTEDSRAMFKNMAINNWH